MPSWPASAREDGTSWPASSCPDITASTSAPRSRVRSRAPGWASSASTRSTAARRRSGLVVTAPGSTIEPATGNWSARRPSQWSVWAGPADLASPRDGDAPRSPMHRAGRRRCSPHTARGPSGGWGLARHPSYPFAHRREAPPHRARPPPGQSEGTPHVRTTTSTLAAHTARARRGGDGRSSRRAARRAVGRARRRRRGHEGCTPVVGPGPSAAGCCLGRS